jgi:hypothetical protein
MREKRQAPVSRRIEEALSQNELRIANQRAIDDALHESRVLGGNGIADGPGCIQLLDDLLGQVACLDRFVRGQRPLDALGLLQDCDVEVLDHAFEITVPSPHRLLEIGASLKRIFDKFFHFAIAGYESDTAPEDAKPDISIALSSWLQVLSHPVVKYMWWS